MRELVPYKTLHGAQKALDNGGRFYNLFSAAADNIIEPSELARATGSLSLGTKAFLFFEMALMDLPPDQRAKTTALLSPDLRKRFEKERPRALLPSLVEPEGKDGISAIVSGFPVFVEKKSQFRGFIVMVVPVIMLIPITDQFDVYEVYDTPEMKTPRTVIATARGSKRLDGVFFRFGGVLRELQFEDKTGKSHGLYLDTLYYTPLVYP
jgi:hypothetical protein